MRRKKLWAVMCCLGWTACAAEAVDLELHESALPIRADAETSAPANQDLFYVTDPFTGRIVREIPLAVLSDIFAQLERRGMTREAEHLQRLYDLRSGRVRDPARIASAEERIRALGRSREAGHEADD